jgi:HK97 family phage major capsid protein/HK97 family phage prohead protease
MDRAYTVLEFRAVDDAARIIEGVASTDAVDSYGTVLEPRGAKYALPMPLLWQHDAESPVGHVLSVTVESDRIRVRAKILNITEAGPVKDTLDRAWQNVKHGLVRGLSVGFEPIKTVGKKFTEWNWRELSLVTLPATPGATISMVRAADQTLLAASGDSLPQRPGVSGSLTSPHPRHGKMTIQEQITQHENSRAAKVARREAILSKCGEEGRTFEPAEKEEMDTLKSEIESHDEYLVELNVQKRAVESRAVPVVATSTATAAQARSGAAPVVSVRSRELPGTGFARYVMAFAVSKGNRYEAAEYAKQAFGDQGNSIAEWHRAAAMQQRTAVAAGTTTDANWAAPLVQTNYVSEFLDLLRPATLLGKIQGLRHVPYNTSIPAVTGGTTFKWVGQGKGKPVTKAQFSAATIGHATAAGISVLTKQLIRLSTPDAQATVRDILVADCKAFLDTQFVDSSVAAVANVNPASITNGVTGTPASGTDVADARSDISARITAFATASYGLDGLVILMSQSQAFALGTMINSVGNPAFPGLGINGGSILGVPVVTSETVGSQIIFAHAPSILVADADGIEIDTSTDATLEMVDTPSDPADASTVYTSMFQNNMVAIRVERMISWGKARSTAVDRITSAAYAA